MRKLTILVDAMVSIGRGMIDAPKVPIIDEPSLSPSPLDVKKNFSSIGQIDEPRTSKQLVDRNARQTPGFSYCGYAFSQAGVTIAGAIAELEQSGDASPAYFGRRRTG